MVAVDTCTVMGTEKELEPSVALTVAVCCAATLAAVAENVAVEAAAATETEAGTERAAALLLVRLTAVPPAGAG
jgi:hypothetical protein